MTQNYFYRIFNRKTGQYVANKSSKSCWTNKIWLVNFIKTRIKNKYEKNENILDIDDLDIHIFPINYAITKSVKDFLNEYQDDINKKIQQNNNRRKLALIKRYKNPKIHLNNSKNFINE